MHCTTMRFRHGHHQPHGFSSHCDCQCHGHHQPPRHFPTKEEVINGLEEYLKNIQQEAEAVEKQLKELKESDQ